MSPAEGTLALVRSDEGEVETVETLVERLRRRFERIVFRYQVPVGDAEDILQTTLLLYVEATRRERIHEPEAWLVATLRNRCLMYWRGKRLRSEPRPTAPSTLEHQADRHHPVPPNDAQVHARVDLVRQLGALRPVEARLLRLFVLESKSAVEVGEILGYAPSSIRKIRNRALAKLRAGLGATEVDGARGERRDVARPASVATAVGPRPRVGHTHSFTLAPSSRPPAEPMRRTPRKRGEKGNLGKRIDRLRREQEELTREVRSARELAARPFQFSVPAFAFLKLDTEGSQPDELASRLAHLEEEQRELAEVVEEALKLVRRPYAAVAVADEEPR